MPELVKNGPNIPVELLNGRDDGNVVFFCGAGVSVGTGLPTLGQLVDQIYTRTGQRPSPLESDLLKRGQLDKVLGLLEERLNPGRLRQEVVARLSEPPTGGLDVHEAILTLSRTLEGRIRLVTTNFDDRFEQAGAAGLAIDAAPKLPIPKPHNWTSVVHLHGCIQPHNSDDHLVLTAADFGRAYLTEGWAARFITELFREFIVVFVGYSLNDPVLSYMVDALAAERSRGARFQKAYAFADHKGGEKGRRKAEIAWGKNVEQIPFHSRNRFSRLNKTLIEWARLCHNPLSTRRKIVLQGIRRLPGNPTDPLAERVCWALSDATIAKTLTHSPPTSQENSFTKIAAWLEIFDQKGLLAPGPQVLCDGKSHQVPIARTEFDLPEIGRLDGVTACLADWLAQHAHVPQVLGWVVRKGGRLHPALRSMLLHRMAARSDARRPTPNIPERLRVLWTIILNDRPADPELLLSADYLLQNAISDFERTMVERALVDSIRPKLAVRPGPSSELRVRRFENPACALTPLEECAHLALTLGDGDTARRATKVFRRTDVLAKYAFELSDHLHLPTELLVHEENSIRESGFYRPAIEAHQQNRMQKDWMELIDWARDSYFALVGSNDGQAQRLLQRWLTFGNGLFKRLALHALTEDETGCAGVAREILLAGEPLGLWDGELHHELLVFLRKAGHRIPQPFLADLITAIKAGPTLEAKPDQDEVAVEQRRQWLIGLRLSRLADAGVALDDESRSLANEWRGRAPEVQECDEFRFWSGAARWISPKEHIPAGWQKPGVDELIAALQNDKLKAEEFEAIALVRPCTAYLAIRQLANQDRWPAVHWQRLLWTAMHRIREKKLSPHRQSYLAELLSTAPRSLWEEIDAAAADFIASFATQCPVVDEPMFRQLWESAWAAISDSNHVQDDDVLTQALNSSSGKLGEAALNRLWKYDPQPSSGLPEQVAPYFDAVASDGAGRLGRVMLASKLLNLFEVDDTWTTEKLLPMMNWAASEEARDLWTAYAWSASAGPNLLAAFKEDFLESFNHYTEIGDQRSNLVYLFTGICLEEPSAFTTQQIHDVVKALPEDVLVAIGRFLEEQLNGNPGERADGWRARIWPWLAKYWPSEAERNTTATSLALVDCLLKAGGAFPEAVGWALAHLRPGTDHVLWRVQESAVHKDYPDASLDLLMAIVPAEPLPPWERHSLREILDELKDQHPDAEANPRFVILYQRAMA